MTQEQISLFEINSGAEFSECGNYRFSLWRIWDNDKPLVMFIGLNPSTANQTDNDPTINSVIRISKFNGYGGIYMMNCFPIVSTDPSVLKTFYQSGNPFEQNQYFISHQKLKSISTICKDIIFAWGNFKIVSEVGRDKQLLNMFPNAKCLSINKNGSPKHPLYCKTDTEFIKYNQNK